MFRGGVLGDPIISPLHSGGTSSASQQPQDSSYSSYSASQDEAGERSKDEHSGTSSAPRLSTEDGEHSSVVNLKPFMRIVLDEMPEDPNPIPSDSQGTVVDADEYQVLIDWDPIPITTEEGENREQRRGLHLIPGVDKFHIVSPSSDEEMERSWENLGRIQDRVRSKDGEEDSRCPRCGSLFDLRRGAVSRRITVTNISVCDRCGQQEAIEDFVLHGLHCDIDVTVSVPEGRNRTGFESEATEDHKEKLKIDVLPLSDWYIVKIWTGRFEAEDSREVAG